MGNALRVGVIVGWRAYGTKNNVVFEVVVVAPAPCLFAPVASEASGIGKALACRRSGASRIRWMMIVILENLSCSES